VCDTFPAVVARPYGLGGPVQRAEQRAALHPGPPPVDVDPNRGHRGQVEHQAAVGNRHAADAVPAAAHPDLQVVLAGEPHCRGDRGGVGTPDDDRRPPVDHRVPHPARVVVPVVVGQQHVACHVPAQCRHDQTSHQLPLAFVAQPIIGSFRSTSDGRFHGAADPLVQGAEVFDEFGRFVHGEVEAEQRHVQREPVQGVRAGEEHATVVVDGPDDAGVGRHLSGHALRGRVHREPGLEAVPADAHFPGRVGADVVVGRLARGEAGAGRRPRAQPVDAERAPVGPVEVVGDEVPAPGGVHEPVRLDRAGGLGAVVAAVVDA
jgi:hypothetical protein